MFDSTKVLLVTQRSDESDFRSDESDQMSLFHHVFGRSDVIKEAYGLKVLLSLCLSPSWLFIKCDVHMCLLASKKLLV